MKKHKLVIFDWGGIVESHADGEYCDKIVYKNLLRRLGLEEIPKNYMEIIYNCSNKNICSISTLDEFSLYIKDFYIAFNLDFSNFNIDNFIKIYKEEFDKNYYYKEVSEYARSLKDICYIGILSNLCILDEERIDKQFNIDEFDYVWLSFKLGFSKPDINIYKKILESCDFKPEDILFIDDSINNLKVAHSLGFHTLLATGQKLDIIKQNVESFLK